MRGGGEVRGCKCKKWGIQEEMGSEKNYKNLRNGVLATNSSFLIPISLQPDGIKLWYFKVRLFDIT